VLAEYLDGVSIDLIRKSSENNLLPKLKRGKRKLTPTSLTTTTCVLVVYNFVWAPRADTGSQRGHGENC
jgi:hypothetical protein